MLFTEVMLLVKFVLLLVDIVFPVTKGLELVLYFGTLFTPRDELKLLLGVITELGLIVLILELVVFVFRLLVLGFAIILSFNPMKVSSKFLSRFLFQISSLFFSIVSKQFDTNTSCRLLYVLILEFLVRLAYALLESMVTISLPVTFSLFFFFR